MITTHGFVKGHESSANSARRRRRRQRDAISGEDEDRPDIGLMPAYILLPDASAFDESDISPLRGARLGQDISRVMLYFKTRLVSA